MNTLQQPELTKFEEKYYVALQEEEVTICVNTEIKNPVIQLDINTNRWRNPENCIKLLAQISEIITKKFSIEK